VLSPTSTSNENAVAQVQNLSKSFGDNLIFHDVNLDVESGQVVTILGRSGVGKSTLLRCMNLLEVPSSGKVLLKGECIFDDGLNVSGRGLIAARRKLSMVFQQFNLFKHLTAVENVSLAVTIALKVESKRAIADAMELLERVGLRHRALAYPHQLSGGEQQRVGIARALAVKPAAILFDEPTSSLDPELRGEVLRVMKSLAAEDVTMVVVTHELSFAREVSDWIVFMDEGTVLEEGPPNRVFDSPEHDRTFRFLNTK